MTRSLFALLLGLILIGGAAEAAKYPHGRVPSRHAPQTRVDLDSNIGVADAAGPYAPYSPVAPYFPGYASYGGWGNPYYGYGYGYGYGYWGWPVGFGPDYGCGPGMGNACWTNPYYPWGGYGGIVGPW